MRDFLDGRPEYPIQLRRKIQQASDMVERSARIVHGSTGSPKPFRGSARRFPGSSHFLSLNTVIVRYKGRIDAPWAFCLQC